MRTSYENWSLESCVGIAVMTALVVLPTASCGVALWVQAGEMNARRMASVETCNLEATARHAGAALPEVGAANSLAELASNLVGLRPELRPSSVAREAFLACMDKRGP